MSTTIYPWLNIIAAFSERDQVIGYGNSLPWPRLSKDMKRFKDLTKNNIVIMGNNTFKSLHSKPLTERVNLVLANKVLQIKDTTFCLSKERVLECARIVQQGVQADSAWVIGGQSIYEQFLPYANKLYITVVHKKFYGDRHFPSIDPTIWELETSEPIDEIIPLTFQTWRRKELC